MEHARTRQWDQSSIKIEALGMKLAKSKLTASYGKNQIRHFRSFGHSEKHLPTSTADTGSMYFTHHNQPRTNRILIK